MKPHLLYPLPLQQIRLCNPASFLLASRLQHLSLHLVHQPLKHHLPNLSLLCSQFLQIYSSATRSTCSLHIRNIWLWQRQRENWRSCRHQGNGQMSNSPTLMWLRFLYLHQSGSRATIPHFPKCHAFHVSLLASGWGGGAFRLLCLGL